MGHRARGLQRPRHRVGVPSARPRQFARLPVGRGRPRGLCDVEQRLCLGLALWNGRDPILKERIFGLTGNQGNHGEDAKEYGGTSTQRRATPGTGGGTTIRRRSSPTRTSSTRRSSLEARSRVRAAGHRHLRRRPLLDRRGALREGRSVRRPPHRAGHERRPRRGHAPRAPVRVVPEHVGVEVDADIPVLRAGADEPRIETEHPFLGKLELVADDWPGGEAPELLFCDNETNDERLFGSGGRSQYPKDGINDHVVSGRETVNPEGTGTKAAFHYRITVAPGETVELRVRLRPAGATTSPWADFAAVTEARRSESDAFYGELTPPGCSDDEANVMRQALAGMLWGEAALLLRRPALAHG